MNEVEVFLKNIEWAKYQNSHKLYAIFDCAQTEDEKIWKSMHQMDDNLGRSLFAGTPDEGLNNVEPVLLDAQAPDFPRLMPWLVQQEKAVNAVVWLASSYTIAAVHENLKSLLTVHLPHERNALLRFYDPRVFIKLMGVLTPSQRARFFVQADLWWIWNARTKLRHTFVKKDTNPDYETTLTTEQMEKFSQLDIADFAQDLTAEVLDPKAKLKHAQGLDNQTIGQHVQQHVQQALGYKIETEESIKTYVLLVAGSLGWAFAKEDQHTKIVDALNNQRSDEDEKLKQLQAYCATLS